MIKNKYLNPAKYYNFIKSKFIFYKKSYSQMGEDLILLNFFEGKRKGFYVDIGANHPKRFNNTYLFYKLGWNGINIEPNPIIFKKLYSSRKKDVNLNIGIGKKVGKMTFYILEPDTLSTFSYNVVKKYEQMGHKIAHEKQIKVLTLGDVLDKHIVSKKDIDFMSIDTEGNDLDVLESNDWDLFRPKFIIIESLEYKKDGFGMRLNYDDYFKNISYIKIANTYINTIYIDINCLNEFKVNQKIIKETI